MKIQNIEVALRLFECGPGWKVMSFENQDRHEVVFRLSHVDGYAEQMAIDHAELADNPIGAMQMIREWMKRRTFQGEVEQKPVAVVSLPHPAIPKLTHMEPLALPQRAPVPEQPQREIRTRLITLDE